MSKESDQLARRLLASPAGSEIRQALERQQKANTATLSENEYLVPVSYAPLPSFAELEMEFGRCNVSILFDGYEFQKHPSCTDIDETPGNKIFLVKHFNRKIGSEEAIAQMDELGYRPATHLEAYAFQKVNPELQRQFLIVALGSYVLYGACHRFAVLDRGSDSRILGVCWFVCEWFPDYRFLFVRK